jgi:carbamoyltransferase
MILLGINNMHDASCALMADGRILAAAEEERFTRKKHTSGLPVHAMRYCLESAGLTARDLDVVIAAWRPWALGVRARLALGSALSSPRAFRSKAARGAGQLAHEWKQLFLLRRLLRAHLGEGRYEVRYLEHHLAHAASAFLCSPFEEAVVLTVDGAGEEDSTVMWRGRGNRIDKVASIRLPHSLGQLYSAATGFLGFKMTHDEYKVMGLAAMGQPRYADQLLRDVLRLEPEGGYSIRPYFLDYHLARSGTFSDQAQALFGPPRRRDEELTERHADIAASVQHALEQALFHALRHMHTVTGSRRMCLAGGVAFNCTANGKIFNNTPFEDVFVQPAAGDAGTALGATLYWCNGSAGADRSASTLTHAYWGPHYDRNRIEGALRAAGLPYTELDESQLVDRVARLLADGNVIGWFQGRMEWGPRALGARSLIADPRRPEIKEKINRIIKKREPFRPFAPSILAEVAQDYFDGYHPSPFMLFTFPVKPAKRDVIPAVTHTDGTARPQGVTATASPRYYRLISRFGELTGVPVLLNTSFNVQEPIVCSPEDALATFQGCEMNYLAIENFLVEKPPA